MYLQFKDEDGRIFAKAISEVVPRIGEAVTIARPGDACGTHYTVTAVNYHVPDQILGYDGLRVERVLLRVVAMDGQPAVRAQAQAVAFGGSCTSSAPIPEAPTDPILAGLLDQAEREMHREGFISQTTQRRIGEFQHELGISTKTAAA